MDAEIEFEEGDEVIVDVWEGREMMPSYSAILAREVGFREGEIIEGKSSAFNSYRVNINWMEGDLCSFEWEDNLGVNEKAIYPINTCIECNSKKVYNERIGDWMCPFCNEE